jgi:hypothetical protein
LNPNRRMETMLGQIEGEQSMERIENPEGKERVRQIEFI